MQLSIRCPLFSFIFFFFFNDTAPPEIYPLSLHAALPISGCGRSRTRDCDARGGAPARATVRGLLYLPDNVELRVSVVAAPLPGVPRSTGNEQAVGAAEIGRAHV